MKKCFAVKMQDGRTIYVDAEHEEDARNEAMDIAICGDGTIAIERVTQVVGA